MLFNNLVEGMKFKLYNEDNMIDYEFCNIVNITKRINYILIDFNDDNCTTVYGKINNPIHKFVEFVK